MLISHQKNILSHRQDDHFIRQQHMWFGWYSWFKKTMKQKTNFCKNKKKDKPVYARLKAEMKIYCIQNLI